VTNNRLVLKTEILLLVGKRWKHCLFEVKCLHHSIAPCLA